MLIDLSLLLTGTVLIQRSIKRQIINIDIKTAAWCLITVSSLFIAVRFLHFMMNTDMQIILMFHIMTQISFIVLAKYLLLQHDTLPYETCIVSEHDSSACKKTQTVDIPNSRMHFTFAIINVIVGVIFLFSCIISLLHSNDDTTSMVIILMVSLFLWIVGFMYMMQRNSGNRSIRVLNITAAVISFILILLFLTGVIIMLTD